ncbi:carbohydrate ABC transporter membrane protein 2, CUT1 family [Actinacidiphila yanglinensis]|uniref:Carbohydrate ABC transporter membrane protein 2, CUT1 family n=1 Tax=Actinacidiphila yanglinensis TaxID=310779 RepID=A0A1H6AWQ8_9ACTN|nr:carbohydrate ABC transporter permease [Actinacidiphila yanglinensis]SEG53041.1 carbohydrate ABC transporter membrane protein 2, CUT1 family [Actinacidiphila yanglinensis]
MTTAAPAGSAPALAPSSRPGRRRPIRRRGDRLGPVSLLGRLITWAWVLFNLAVFLWMVFASLKNSGQVFDSPWQPPTHPEWSNYGNVWNASDLARAFVNSILLVGGSTLVVLVLACPAAYALSRFVFFGSRVMTLYFVMGMGIPAQTIVVPAYIGMSHLSLVDSLPSLGLLYVAGSLPFAIFLLTGFFSTLPSELEEAATIDGAGRVRTFTQVMLPLAQPGVITAGLLTAVGLWSETFLSLVFISDDARDPLGLSVLTLYASMQYTSNWGGLFAGVCIMVLPVLVTYVWLGRRIVSGLTVGVGR